MLNYMVIMENQMQNHAKSDVNYDKSDLGYGKSRP